jgi:hypothetical protein
MSDPSYRFPAELVRTIATIHEAVRIGTLVVVRRRRHMADLERLGIRDAEITEGVRALAPRDFHRGPEVDHHDSERVVWIFGPAVGVLGVMQAAETLKLILGLAGAAAAPVAGGAGLVDIGIRSGNPGVPEAVKKCQVGVSFTLPNPKPSN